MLLSLKRLFFYCSIIGILIYSIVGRCIVMYGRQDTIPTHIDVMIVFGNKVNPNGTLSAILQDRLNTAISICKTNCPPKIIVSGGFGKEGYREAEVMKNYLVSTLGESLSGTNIIVDNIGDNTISTVKNSLSTVKNSLPYITAQSNIIVVSSYYHIARISYLYKNIAGINVYHSSAKIIRPRDVYGILREIIALIQYTLLGYE